VIKLGCFENRPAETTVLKKSNAKRWNKKKRRRVKELKNRNPTDKKSHLPYFLEGDKGENLVAGGGRVVEESWEGFI